MTPAMKSTADLEAELEDIAEKHEDYFYGSCAAFAIALHKVSRRTIYGLIGYDEDIEDMALVHAYVYLDADRIVDVRGPRPRNTLEDDFSHDNAARDAEEVDFIPSELAKLGGAKREAIKAAMPIARRVWAIALELQDR